MLNLDLPVLFVSETQAQCNTVATVLTLCGSECISTARRDLGQRDREKTLVRFRNTSHGLDVEDVSLLVVCYELNKEVDVHVHRVGRTARAETFGVAVSLVNTAAVPIPSGGRRGGDGGGGGEIGRLDFIAGFGLVSHVRMVVKE